MIHFQPLLGEVNVLSIPILGIIFGCSVAIVAIYTQHRRKQEAFALYHQERMAAIEKGIELPPLPEVLLTDEDRVLRMQARPAHPRRFLLKGLVWLFIGLGLMVALWFNVGHEEAGFGLIPAGIGLAYLIYYAAVGRKEAELADAAQQAALAEASRLPRV